MACRTTITAALALVLIGLGGDAEANKRAAKREYERAKASFGTGHFRTALVHYKRAYSHAPLPGFLFNIAQCHRNLGELPKAVHFFRLYLTKSPKAPNRKAVEALLRELEKKLKPPPPDPPDPGAGGTSTGGTSTGGTSTGGTSTGGTSTGGTSTGGTSTGGTSKDDGGPAVSADGPAGPTTGAGATGDPSDPDGRADAVIIAPPPPPPPKRTPPFYKRWWFWTAVVAAVGGGVVGTYFATRGGSDLPDTRFPVFDVSQR